MFIGFPFYNGFLTQGYLYALDGKTGSVKWVNSDYMMLSSPSIGSDGTLYLTAAKTDSSSWVVALDPKTGKITEYHPPTTGSGPHGLIMDTQGNKSARGEIAMIKVAVPRMLQTVVDRAIQVHGGAGVSQDFFLAEAFAETRFLRIGDGPDEVHREALARIELARAAN